MCIDAAWTMQLFESDNSIEFTNYLQRFDIKKFINLDKLKTNYNCKTCLHAFSIDVLAYLRLKHFLIIENGKILPTPLGKAAFASSIAPEES